MIPTMNDTVPHSDHNGMSWFHQNGVVGLIFLKTKGFMRTKKT